MKVLINQIIIEQKLFFRDMMSVFWTFFFPLILLVLIGWFFSKTDRKINIYVYDQDKTARSAEFIKLLNDSDSIKTIPITSSKEYHTLKEFNKGQVILVLKKGFENNINKNSQGTIDLYYNLAYGSHGDDGLTSFYQLLPKLNEKLTNKSIGLTINKMNLGNKGRPLTYIDFLTPGVIAMSVMSTCLFGVGIVITSYREKGKLRRLALTPLKKSVFILGHIIHRYIVVLLQGLTLIILGYLIFGIKIFGDKGFQGIGSLFLDIISLLVVMTIGLLTFIAMGFMVASRAKKSETSAAIANLLFFPMLLLGGVYFSVENIPEILKPIVNLLPLSHLTIALRQVINYGEPFYTLTEHFIPQLIVMILCFIVSIKAFRWE